MALRDIEDAVTDAVTAGWASSAEDFRRAVLALWAARGESLSAEEVRALAAQMDRPGQMSAVEATALLMPAAEDGDARIRQSTAVHMSSRAVQALRDARQKPGEALEEMGRRLLVADLASLPELVASIAPARTSVSQMQATSSWATHAAANEATVSAARQADERLVFVPERDACLDCIPHGGEVHPVAPTPPIHPRCRCELQPFDDDSVPAALRRESVRSVLRGFSLPSESEAARVRAARALLGRNPVAPESVKRYARAAVRRGRFARTRSVP